MKKIFLRWLLSPNFKSPYYSPYTLGLCPIELQTNKKVTVETLQNADWESERVNEDGAQMCRVWVSDQNSFRPILAWKYSAHEMCKSLLFIYISQLHLCYLFLILFLLQENCKAVADEYIECEFMVNLLYPFDFDLLWISFLSFLLLLLLLLFVSLGEDLEVSFFFFWINGCRLFRLI